ncbi:MAG: SGNH/GDSL hydrolase family protein [Patescibacteria group bacterium]
MWNYKQSLLLLFLLASSLIVSFLGAFYIGEHYFFDKLFYQKSAIHGYEKDTASLVTSLYKNNSDLPKEQQPSWFIKERIKDLHQLVASNTNSPILGVSTSKEENSVFKIVIIGDSFVYGTGVRENQRFGNVLEEKLNKIKPTKVYSLGLNGDSIVDNYLKYLLAQKEIQPDLVIFGMVENDLFLNSPRYPNHENLMNTLKEKCTLPQFEYYFEDPTASYDEQLAKAYLPSFSDEYGNICYMDQILQQIDMSKSFFFVFNDLYSQNEDQPQKKIMTKYERMVIDHNGVVIHPSDPENAHYYTVSKQEGHPSARQHEEYAEKLFSEITSNSTWGFKE